MSGLEFTDEAARRLEALYLTADVVSQRSATLDQLDLAEGETGVFLCTAHPAKFREDVEETLDVELELPEALAEVAEREVLSQTISSDFEEFKPLLLNA